MSDKISYHWFVVTRGNVGHRKLSILDMRQPLPECVGDIIRKTLN